MSYIAEILPPLLQGAVVSVELFIITLVLALPLGLPFAFGEMSRFRPVRWICKIFVFVFRGTPLMLQLFFFYFFFPLVLNIDIPAFPAAILTFVLNYAAYFAEIYRGGILSIDQGQYEAAHSLGLSRAQTTFGIIVPQAMRVVLPPVSNEAITLVKDTALASVISMSEMMRVSEGIVNRDYNLTAYVVAAAIYLLFTFLLTLVLNHIEARFSTYTRREN